MGFTLGVENAPASATHWMASCNYYSTGIPGMPGPLPLAKRWNCAELAPGYNTLGIACFDAAGYIVQESFVEVTILDNKAYTFDFATETLRITEAIPAVSWLPLIMIGRLGVLGLGVVVALSAAKPKE